MTMLELEANLYRMVLEAQDVIKENPKLGSISCISIGREEARTMQTYKTDDNFLGIPIHVPAGIKETSFISILSSTTAKNISRIVTTIERLPAFRHVNLNATQSRELKLPRYD